MSREAHVRICERLGLQYVQDKSRSASGVR